MNFDEFLAKYLESPRSAMNGLKGSTENVLKKRQAIYDAIGYEFPLCEMGKAVYLYVNKLPKDSPNPICSFCGVLPTKFQNAKEGYSKWCSSKCCISDYSRMPEEAKKKALYAMHSKTKELLEDSNSGFREKLSKSSKHAWSDEILIAEQSARMKAKIKSGDFTPNVTNSWTRWGIDINGKKFRSSFEGVFHMAYPRFEYETLRLQYIFDGKERTYITDFVDRESKTIYELKPKSLKENPKNIAKEQYARAWCAENGFTFTYVCEDEIKQLAKSLLMSYPDDEFLLNFAKKYKL